MKRERLFIIDGFGQIFRAFYGVRSIDNNAVFGFTTMLKKLIADEQPEYMVVAFDTPTPTFRKELYPEYKANRDAMPVDLRPQIPLIKEFIQAMNIPMVEFPGYEADDVMGTLAKMAAEQDMQAVIVSGDKDMLQLIRGEDIVIYDARKGVHYLNESQVPDHFGVRADQVIDLLTIWGDSSDNIPGVPGVGEKGAKTLLETYSNIEGIYENLDKIKRKSYREGFEKARDTLELTKKLVTICTDMELTFNKEAYRMSGADETRLFDLFERLNFKTLLKDIPIKMKRCETEYELLDTPERLESMASKIREKGFMIFDVETTSLDPIDAELTGVALSHTAGQAGYAPLRHEGQNPEWAEQAESILKSLLADEQIAKCAHNAKYDLSVLTARGWELNGVFHDTMLMSYLLNPTDTRHGLDTLAENVLRYKTIHFEDVCGEGKDQISFNQVGLKEACQYAGEDADICFQLYNRLWPELEKQGLQNVYENVELPLIPVLTHMELTGIRVDRDYLKSMSDQMGDQIQELEKEIYELAGEEFNIKSTKQLGHILFEKLELPAGRKTAKTKSYSTNQEVLERLAKLHPLPAKLLDYRMLTKLKSTYVDALPGMIHPKTDRVHSSFNQFVTATGRLSSNNPNLQNIPIRSEMGREIRGAFLPAQDYVLVAADYSQIELRLMAHFSEDPTLLAAFNSGEDIHARTAGEIMGAAPELVTTEMRSMAKSINFGLIYGMGDFRLAQELGITRKKAKEYIETYFEKMPKVLTFRDQVIEKARKDGEIRTFSGRKRELPEINSRNKSLQSQGERLAVNTLIQGSAAELIKLAMIKLHKRLKSDFPEARLLLQVHDELVLECPRDQAEAVTAVLVETMEGVVDFKAPLTVEAHTGENWKEAK